MGTGVVVGTIKHLAPDEREQLTVETMSTEALTTSEIEGEILDRASVQSSIRKQLGLSTESRRVGPAEQGIAEMMVDLYRPLPSRSPMRCCLPGTARWSMAAETSGISGTIAPETSRWRWSREQSMIQGCILRRRRHRTCPGRWRASRRGSAAPPLAGASRCPRSQGRGSHISISFPSIPSRTATVG